MTLEVEHHSGAIWLMYYTAPGTYLAERLARFDSMESAETYKKAFGIALMAARAAGASGI